MTKSEMLEMLIWVTHHAFIMLETIWDIHLFGGIVKVLTILQAKVVTHQINRGGSDLFWKKLKLKMHFLGGKISEEKIKNMWLLQNKTGFAMLCNLTIWDLANYHLHLEFHPRICRAKSPSLKSL